MPEWLQLLALYVPVGFLVGLVGSLIGVGGGFFVVPFLLYQGFRKEDATAASLGIVLLSAMSGTWANAKRKRLDYGTAVLLAAGALPGGLLGRLVIKGIADRTFAISFGILLVLVAGYVLFVRLKRGQPLVRGTPRQVTDSEGQVHDFQVQRPLAFLVSIAIGMIGSLFGIGGGLLLVPFLVVVFGMPAVCATAAAQFTFLFNSAASLAISMALGQMTLPGWRVVGLLGPGVIVGAQVGVTVAKRVPERVFRILLAAVILGVAYTLFRRA